MSDAQGLVSRVVRSVPGRGSDFAVGWFLSFTVSAIFIGAMSGGMWVSALAGIPAFAIVWLLSRFTSRNDRIDEARIEADGVHTRFGVLEWHDVRGLRATATGREFGPVVEDGRSWLISVLADGAEELAQALARFGSEPSLEDLAKRLRRRGLVMRVCMIVCVVGSFVLLESSWREIGTHGLGWIPLVVVIGGVCVFVARRVPLEVRFDEAGFTAVSDFGRERVEWDDVIATRFFERGIIRSTVVTKSKRLVYFADPGDSLVLSSVFARRLADHRGT